MPKTLEDMTGEEVAACRGMWCMVGTFKTPRVLLNVGAGYAHIFNTQTRRDEVADPHRVTPRFDLPHAWTPEGRPIPGKWEEGWAGRRFATDWEKIPAQESDSKASTDRGQDNTITVVQAKPTRGML